MQYTRRRHMACVLASQPASLKKHVSWERQMYSFHEQMIKTASGWWVDAYCIDIHDNAIAELLREKHFAPDEEGALTYVHYLACGDHPQPGDLPC